MNAHTILVVDDDPMTRQMLSDMLRLQSYDVHVADGGLEALRMVKECRPDLILLDLIMPDVDGYDVASRVRGDPSARQAAIIMITGRDVTREKTRALEAGADDLLSKPICMAELLARVRTTLNAKAYTDRLEHERSILELEVARQTAALRRALDESAAAALEIVRRLALAAEFRDVGTGAHIERVSRYAQVIASAMGIPEEECRLLRLASTMHDVGKIGVPDDVLRKPGKLTHEEMAVMQQHTSIGAQILQGSNVPLVRTAAEIALHHHEWWDGRGYPNKLSGESIPRFARIVSVADAIDAMTSMRPYRRSVSMEEAFAEVSAMAGQQFDPDVVQAVQHVRTELIAIRSEFAGRE